jgi:cytochrome c-type biogenesis protein
MIGGVGNLVASGPLILAVPVALAAGAVTFLSPCCLPLVPGYLSYVTGMSGTDASRAAHRSPVPGGPEPGGGPDEHTLADRAEGTPAAGRAAGGSVATTARTATGQAAGGQAAGGDRSRLMAGAVLFVLGFSALFTSYGVLFGEIGERLLVHEQDVTRILGGVTILLGLMFAGVFDRFTLAGRIVRPSWRPRAGLAGAPLLGVMFALTWTPCAGPTLAVVLAMSGTSGTAARGALLAFCYAIGIGIPFLIVAFAFRRGMSAFGFARRHGRLISTVGGLMLVAVGLLEVTGAWGSAMIWLKFHWIGSYQSPL